MWSVQSFDWWCNNSTFIYQSKGTKRKSQFHLDALNRGLKVMWGLCSLGATSVWKSPYRRPQFSSNFNVAVLCLVLLVLKVPLSVWIIFPPCHYSTLPPPCPSPFKVLPLFSSLLLASPLFSSLLLSSPLLYALATTVKAAEVIPFHCQDINSDAPPPSISLPAPCCCSSAAWVWVWVFCIQGALEARSTAGFYSSPDTGPVIMIWLCC